MGFQPEIWGYSSAGRAPALQAGGQRFDPAYLHHRFGKTEYRFALVIRESESKTWACSSGG